MASKDEHVPVLIVGGSVVGLSTALFLAWHDIPTLLVERHPDTSIHPRAGSFNTRTMELFRQVGLESAIMQQEAPLIGEMGLRVESLTGKILDSSERIVNQQYQQPDPFASPTSRALIGQHKLEPIIRRQAQALGSDIRFGTELVAFEQHTEGVTARIRERATGNERCIQARYLVAADGNKSTIRQQLGIGTYGYGTLGQWVSIRFRANLQEVLHGRTITLCFVNNSVVEGIMGQGEEKDHWGLFAHIKQEPGEQSAELSEARCLALVRAAIGIPDVPVEILGTLYWELAARVAEQYQQGHILLAGDAAHVMTTMGAFGANTGIADAHNLAWKLAAVLKGWAHPDLLRTYNDERRPAADLAVAVSLGLYAYRLPGLEHKDAMQRSAEELLSRVCGHSEGLQPSGFSVVSGYRYRSAAIIAEGEENDALFENAPSGHPGTRAPHIWLHHNGKEISTLDLFGKNFVLLTGSNGQCWREASASVEKKLNIPVVMYSIGQKEAYRDSDGTFLSAYDITNSGATLIRPDGFIAWRAKESDTQATIMLEQALTQSVCMS